MPFVYTCSDPNYTIYCGINSDENDLLAKYMWPNDILFHVSNLSSGHIYLRCNSIDCIDLKIFKKCKTITDFFKLFKIPINVIEECLHLTKESSIKGKTLDSVNIDITPWLNVEKIKGTKSGTIHFKNMKYVTILNMTYNTNNNNNNKMDNNKSNKNNKKNQKKKKGKKDDKKAEEKANTNDIDDDFLDYEDDSDSSSDDSSSDDDDHHNKIKKKKKTATSKNVYNKKQWKKKLKALEKTKEIIDVKNVEKYLIQQQMQRNQVLKSKQKKTKQKLKEKEKKERMKKKKAQDLKNYVGVFDEENMTSNRNMTADFEDNFM